MGKAAKKALVPVLGVIFVLMFGAGCEEQQAASSPKKDRLIATENLQLKQQIEQKDAEIKTQKEQIAKCGQDKAALEEQVQKGIKEQVDSVLSAVVDRTAVLAQENEQLKGQLDQLKKGGEKPAANSNAGK